MAKEDKKKRIYGTAEGAYQSGYEGPRRPGKRPMMRTADSNDAWNRAEQRRMLRSRRERADERYKNTPEGAESYRRWKEAKADPNRTTTPFKRGDWMSSPKATESPRRSAILRKMGER
jgi:hypothetical protein